jgi:prepilin-type N-terminal cleavage/methylation domain-containing protein
MTDRRPVRRPARRIARGARGFSLTELAMVLGLVSVLAAIAVTSAKYMRDRARMGLYYAELRDVAQASLRFKQDMGYFPPDVAQGVDPSLVSKDGYRTGGHSPAWEGLDLSRWNGPYLAVKHWPKNPWGGPLDYDYFPDGNAPAGLADPGIYLSARANFGMGNEGMPAPSFEESLEAAGTDHATEPGWIALRIGEASATAPVP